MASVRSHIARGQNLSNRNPQIKNYCTETDTSLNQSRDPVKLHADLVLRHRGQYR